ncbi:MAG: hypothetical protein M3O62_09385 [Pseudomonadota bacterium]|nr:hypothetical protein [Pseudomonadota bacterium]
MNTEQLASAYADAVVDHLEFGIDQGIVFKDGRYLLAGRRECEITPHLWVDRHWRAFVPEIDVPADPRDSNFDEFQLRALIVESLVVDANQAVVQFHYMSSARGPARRVASTM